MISVQIVDYSMVIAFWLAFTRISTIAFHLPIFDNNSIPQMVKVLTCLMITFAFFPIVQTSLLNDVKAVGIEHFWVLTIFNVVVGILIGQFIKIIMYIFAAAGMLITQQVGFNAISLFDPTTETRGGPFEILLTWVLLLMILTSGALLPMFKGIIGSFGAISFYHWGNMSNSIAFFQEMFVSIFNSAIMLASPMIFVNFLITVVLGIISRMVPQLNVISVSFIINIGLGLIVFATMSDEFFEVAYKMYVDHLGNWFLFVTK